MDYRALLLRYMAHVMDGEGTSFIDAVGRTVRFTIEEKTELIKLEKEALVVLRQ
jgi:hypothetical protein